MFNWIPILAVITLLIAPSICDDHDHGWCTKMVPNLRKKPVWRTRIEMVTKPGWFKTYTIPVRKKYLAFETEQTLTSVRFCCTGYKLNKTDDGSNYETCDPICYDNDGCPEKSICTAPNECTCSAEGYRSEIVQQTEHCKPICPHGCPAHSECFMPGQCKCLQGYTADNGECLPGCRKACPAHSSCTAPNTCSCDDGYKMNSSNSSCEAVCYDGIGCPRNSVCTAPNECSCNMDGYRRQVITRNEHCEAICTLGCPEYSECLRPEQCVCFIGYAEVNRTCKPACIEQECPPHSTCTAPNVCSCDRGYRFNSNGTECEPICYEDIGGCPANSICSAPNECFCNATGYRRELISQNGHCEPICNKSGGGCSTHGKCIAPETCECFPGYRMSPNADKIECQPECRRNNCTNGFCFAPEICVCHAGYLMGPGNQCEPVCSLGCTNGQCIEPEICECLPGFRMAANSVHACEPICEPKCVNADCAAPDICICWQNYEPIHDHGDTMNHTETFAVDHDVRCVPTCPGGCLHGFCSEPSNCSCDPGYRRHSYIPNDCVPTCTDCIHGDCVEPERCLCWPGFELRKTANSEQCHLIETQTATISISTTELERSSTSTESIFSSSSSTSSEMSTTDLPPCWDHCNCWFGNSSSMCQKNCSEELTANCISPEFCDCTSRHTLRCTSSSSDPNMSDYACQLQPESTINNISLLIINQQHKSRPHWILFICMAVLTSTIVVAATIAVCKRKLHSASHQAASDPNNFVVQYEK